LEIKVQKIELLESVKETIFSNMKLRMDISAINEELIANIDAIFSASQGKCNVEFFIEDSTENLSVKLPSKSRKIGITSDLTAALDKIGDLTYELS
jgi:DNA polymerase-3 subunit alpha